MANTTATVINIVDSLAAVTNRTRSTISRLSSGSGATIDNLSNGHDITTARLGRIIQWLSDHWPQCLTWPPDIPRPESSPDSPAALAAQPGSVLTPPEYRADHPNSVLTAPEYRAGPPPAPPISDRQAALIAALALDAQGRIASPRALCAALKVPRYVYDGVLRYYADGRSRAHRWPRKLSDSAAMLDHLTESGDIRFSARRTRQEQVRANARGAMTARDHDTRRP